MEKGVQRRKFVGKIQGERRERRLSADSSGNRAFKLPVGQCIGQCIAAPQHLAIFFGPQYQYYVKRTYIACCRHNSKGVIGN